MKTLKFLLATLAVSCAFSATAFAAELSNDYDYTFKLKVTPETVNAGETISVGVYLSATDSTGSAIDSLTAANTDDMSIAIGLDYNKSVLTWIDNYDDGLYTDTAYDCCDLFDTVQDNDGNLTLQYQAKYRKIGAITPDTVLVTYKFKVADDATTATYDNLVALVSGTTSYLNATKNASTLNKTMSNATVSVVGAGPVEDKTVTAEEDANGVTTIKYGKDYTGSKALEGKKIVVKTLADTDNITKETRFNVTFGDETKPYGGTLWDQLGLEGKGALAVNKLTIAIAFDADVENVTAANVSVALVK